MSDQPTGSGCPPPRRAAPKLHHLDCAPRRSGSRTPCRGGEFGSTCTPLEDAWTVEASTSVVSTQPAETARRRFSSTVVDDGTTGHRGVPERRCEGPADAVWLAVQEYGAPMRLVMTLVVRNEEELLETNLDYHFAQGVDFALVTDHDSTDGTPEILERYAREGLVRVFTERFGGHDQGRRVTRMARIAARGTRGRLGHQQRRRRVLVAAARQPARRLRRDSPRVRADRGPAPQLRARGLTTGSPSSGACSTARRARLNPSRLAARVEGRPPGRSRGRSRRGQPPAADQRTPAATGH